MTRIHPLSDDSIVNIDEDEFHSSQKAEEQKSNANQNEDYKINYQIIDEKEKIESNLQIIDTKNNESNENDFKENQILDQNSILESNPIVDQNSVLDQILDQNPVLKQNQSVDQNSVLEQNQIMDQNSVLEQNQIIDQNSVLEQNQIIDQNSVLEQNESVDQNSVLEQNQSVDQNSVLEQNQSVDQNSVLEQISSNKFENIELGRSNSATQSSILKKSNTNDFNYVTSSSSSSDSSLVQEQKNQLNNLKNKMNDSNIFKPILNGIKDLNILKSKEKSNDQDGFTFTWSNLSYHVFISTRFGLRKKKKFIFRQINGELKSNQLFGLLGPSGAGKSSLLDCLSFKRIKNITGDIKINGKLNKYKMAYIPQHDEYLEDLTCLEILVYASRLKNHTASIDDTLLTLNKEIIENQQKISNRVHSFHYRVAKNVLNLLGLSEQANTYAGRLSGGQKKRLSISQELVIKPHIIFLDEPTSGLDSNSSYQCIKLLHEISKQSTPIAIVCTIHQPNPKTLKLFDQIYVLSNDGKVIYNAPPEQVIPRLRQENIDVPLHYAPADYLLELASGEFNLRK